MRPPHRKKKGPALLARPFLEPSYLLEHFRAEIDRALASDQATDPGRVFGPGGSDPAAAVRVSARRPAADPASVRGSDFAGPDSGSDWTLRSPFFQSRRRTTAEPDFGCGEIWVPPQLFPARPNPVPASKTPVAENYPGTSSRGAVQHSCRNGFPLLKIQMTRRPAAGAFAVSN